METSPDLMKFSKLTPGKAYLVGAGPGDPGLLTVKASVIVRQADVILYDYLADARILQAARSDAICIDVGKSGVTGHKLSQSDIEALLIAHCLEGKTVCRLKGGDPYIFGRGAEEGEALFAAGIPFEVVPGISSAIAVPAYAGIPVTYRHSASAVSIITGHEDPTKPTSQLDWAVLSRMSGTLVFLMGMKQLPAIVSQLMTYGKAAQTPIALIQWGTRPQQRTVTGTLETILDILKKTPLLPPCIIVVGEVVQARSALNWFETLPLFGKTIVVTRARTQASGLRLQLEALGASVIELPTIEILPISPSDLLDKTLRGLNTMYDWILWTSPHGVTQTMLHLQRLGLDVRHLAGIKLGVIGSVTAETLHQYGLKADLIPETFVAESLFMALESHHAVVGNRFLLPRADIAREDIEDMLAAAGASVTALPIYKTVSAPLGQNDTDFIEALRTQSIDVLTFSSSSTVTQFVARLQSWIEKDSHLLDAIKFASIGPITSKTLKEALGRVDIEASTHTIPGLIEAIQTYYCLQTHVQEKLEV